MALRPVSDPSLLARLNGGSPKPVQISGPDPKLPGQVQGQGLNNRQTQQEIERQGQLTPWQIRAAKAQALKAEKDLEAKPSGDPRAPRLQALQAQLERVAQLYKTGPGATKGLSGLMDYAPTPANKQFDTAAAGLGELGMSAFRVPGAGSQSDAELKAFISANTPSSSDYDVSIEEKMRNIRNRLNHELRGAMPQRPAGGGKQQSKVIDFNDLPE